ncbi:hypothetical protein F511_23900 [Dorcoceras hygrometricum]|uniref:Methyltransferase-like protein 17, mitochondrial n=1 Tax=Dorcoceras hygrometricum TaxID=472368 RepID=A0A2Z7DA53_9LAMI|nr:hypothetical protein F511_07564 [Dorcoceras hygrometricum]KZV54258.1 hypothetical protein F511_23900 [Dorcoceras hygrometricum]
MASMISEKLPKFTAETLRAAAKLSERCRIVPVHLRRAIDNYLQEQDVMYMKRKVLSLSQSFNGIKEANLLLPASTSKDLVEDPLKANECSQRWKVKSAYGDTGLKYQEDQAIAYVAARMPAVYSALYRVLSEVYKRRVPDFVPAKVLDFGAGTSTALWAMLEVWPGTLEQINLVEPSQSMQRAGQSLMKGLQNLPLIHSYDNIPLLTKHINKSGRRHDLVIASYVLGEIPSVKDRITLVRQLWDLTEDILILVEPGTPQGSSIISQMRSHILWMEKRRIRKLQNASNKASKDLLTHKTGAFIVAPCPHDGPCPLQNTEKYCHFVQRLERTSSQRSYKRSKGPLRGFEDEKFCYVAFRRGLRPREPWPLDGMKFDTLKEMHAKRIPEDLEMDAESQFFPVEGQDDLYETDDLTDASDSNALETDSSVENDDVEGVYDKGENGEMPRADLGSGWGRIIYMPFRRGKRVELDVCRSTNGEGTEGSFDRVVITQSKNPTLHHQARRSIWGDLWPLRSEKAQNYLHPVRLAVAIDVYLSCRSEAIVKSCIRYLEAVPWEDIEEGEIVQVVSRLDPMAMPIVARIQPVNINASKGVLISAIRLATSTDHPFPPFGDELRISAQEQVDYMLRDDEDMPLVTDDDEVKMEARIGLSNTFSLFEEELSSVLKLEVTCSVAESKIMQNISDLEWMCNILSKMGLMYEFVIKWIGISDKVLLVVEDKKLENIMWGLKVKIIEVTSKALDAVGYGTVILPAPQRVKLLRSWLPFIRNLKPILDSMIDNDMEFPYKMDEETYQTIEGAIVSLVLALPSDDQADILADWMNTEHLTYPDLSEAFEVWSFRSKSAKRRLLSGLDRVDDAAIIH